MSGVRKVLPKEVDDALRMLLRTPTSYFWRFAGRVSAVEAAVVAATKVIAVNTQAIKDLQGSPSQPVEWQTRTYEVDHSLFPNPERGLMSTSASAHPTPIEPWDPNASMTLEWVLLNLDAYRDRDLDQEILDGLAARLGGLRGTAAKAIFRPRYTEKGDGRDAPLPVVLRHVAQVAQVLNQYSDVIYAYQVGWAGSWGETGIAKAASGNNLVRGENRDGWVLGQIIERIHDLSPQLYLQLRRAGFAGPSDLPTKLPFGLFKNPFLIDIAFQGSLQAHTGFYNDCLGTGHQGSWNYGGDGMTKAQRLRVLSAATAFTPTAGETCGPPNTHSRHSIITGFLQQLHFDALHAAYSMPIIQDWTQATRDLIAQKLGYRYELLSAMASTTGQLGTILALKVKMRNSGWGRLYLPRALHVVFTLSSKPNIQIAVVALPDCRSVLPGPGVTATFELSVAIPEGLSVGTYELGLRLPDPDARLAKDARRAVRFANAGTWNPKTGINDLLLNVVGKA